MTDIKASFWRTIVRHNVTWEWIMEVINAYCMIFPVIGLAWLWAVKGDIPLMMILWAIFVWSWGLHYYIRRSVLRNY